MGRAKPLVYLAALGVRARTAATVLNDAPVIHGGWKPQKANGRFLGPASVRTALARSISVVAVKGLGRAGVDPVLHLVRALGIASPAAPRPPELS